MINKLKTLLAAADNANWNTEALAYYEQIPVAELLAVVEAAAYARETDDGLGGDWGPYHQALAALNKKVEQV